MNATSSLARALATIALATMLSTSACRMYEWRDEPCIRPVVAEGVAAAIDDLTSFWDDDRTIACRALGQLAIAALDRGDAAEARRIAQLLMDHFERESCHQVRSVILALVLRDIGRNNDDVKSFLLARLAADELPVAAAYTLAVLRPPGAFEAMHAAVLRSEPERRYELLQAMWLLGDPRAVPVFREQLRDMDRDWPDHIHHMDKSQYRKVLLGRAQTLQRSTAPASGGSPTTMASPTR